VQRFYVESDEAKISDLVVEDLEFLAEGIRFDLLRTFLSGRAELSEVTHGQLSLKVSEQALEDRWGGELGRSLSKVEVDLSDKGVAVSGVMDLMLTEMRVGARGEFIVDGTDRVRFKVNELELGGASIGVEQLKAVFTALTPVIDLGQFKLQVVLDEAYTSAGYLFIEARSRSLEEKLAADRERQRQAREAERTEEFEPVVGEATGSTGAEGDLGQRVSELIEAEPRERGVMLGELWEELKGGGERKLAEFQQVLDEQWPRLKEEGGELLGQLQEMLGELRRSADSEDTEAGDGDG
jgi:hypothetical protein